MSPLRVLVKRSDSAYHARVSIDSGTDDHLPSGEPSFLLRGIFHVHTNASKDCRMSAETVVAKCIDEGVDVLAVTDHHSLQGARELQRQAPFQVIVGEEILTAEGGEIIGLFLQECIPQGRPAIDVIREIRLQGGLVYLPHPFDRLRTKRWPPSLRASVLRAADILEVFNARSLTHISERRATAAVEQSGKVACVGADAHFPTEIGPTVVFLRPFSTPETLLTSLRTATVRHRRSPRWVFPATKLVELRR